MNAASFERARRFPDTGNARSLVVLHVIKSLFSAGGTPRELLGLARASAGSGVAHAFLVFDDAEDTLTSELRAAGSSVAVVSRRSPLDFRLVGDIVRTARVVGADVIGTHFARADVLGVVGARRLRLPVVKHLHGIIVNERPLVRVADHALGRYRAAVICNSEAIRLAEVERSGIRNAVVVLNGVENVHVPDGNARDTVRRELGIGTGDLVVGHIGGLIPARDQHLLIEAVARLRAAGVPARVVIAGDGPELPLLRQLAHDRHVEDCVTFCGYRSDVPRLLVSMDVYVNMCRAEGFGIAVVEAMHAGLPVVVADAGALPEVVRDELDGLIVRAGDLEALARQLRRLALDPALRRRLGAAAQMSARARFSMSRYVQEMNDVYRWAASESRGVAR